MFTSGQLTAKGQSFCAAAAITVMLVIISTMVDQLVPFFPAETGVAQWRFERFGTFLGAIPMLTIEIMVVVVLASMAGQRRSVRTMAIFAIAIAVITIPLVLAFLLDFVEVRRIVQVPNRSLFDRGAMKTGLFGGLFVLPLLWTGWRGIQATTVEANPQRTKGQGLVVGQ